MCLPFADPFPLRSPVHRSSPNFLQENSFSRVNTFLGAKVTSGLLGSHASAITAYALSLTEAPEDLRRAAHNNLMAMAKDIGGEGVLAVVLRLGRA